RQNCPCESSQQIASLDDIILARDDCDGSGSNRSCELRCLRIPRETRNKLSEQMNGREFGTPHPFDACDCGLWGERVQRDEDLQRAFAVEIVDKPRVLRSEAIVLLHLCNR